jgi:hypothetical protein
MSIKERRDLESKANANLKALSDATDRAAKRAHIVRKINDLGDGNAHGFTLDRLMFDIEQSAERAHECVGNLRHVITEQQRGLFREHVSQKGLGAAAC